MMNTKRLISMALVLVMLLSILCACQPETPEESGNATYKVTVIGVDGKPMTTGVVVKFMQGGAQKAMQTVDAAGVAAKELPKGEYNVELMSTKSDVTLAYDKDNLTLSATKTELTIELYNTASEPDDMLNVKVEGQDELKEYSSYKVFTGRTQVELVPGDRTFFIFYPAEGGIYHFTVEGNVGAVGYYGGPFAVQANNLAQKVEGQENVITVDVQEGSAGAPHVLGIDVPASDAKSVTAMLKITKVGDLPPELPYTIYKMTATELKPYVHNDAPVTDFDLMKSYNLVLNEEDGYYHLDSKDGPLVLVRLGHNADKTARYMASVFTVTQNDPFQCWYFDADGKVTQKLGFQECLNKYMENEMPPNSEGRNTVPVSYTYVDYDSGLYPLTEDLKFILQETGKHKGWWDKDRPTCLFRDDMGNLENFQEESAWLFWCCYVEEA